MFAVVADREQLTPYLHRLRLRGGELEAFEMKDATDAYINAAFAVEGAPYGEVFDPGELRTSQPRELWPARRRYTVRRWEPDTQTLTLDVLAHGANGVGGNWAASAEPGSVLVFEGPSGGYRPDPTADWHLMAGDESALPAIAASLEAVPAGARVIVRLVCDGPEHEVPLETPGEVDLAWLYRSGSADDTDLLAIALAGLDWPSGRVHGFVHGEADEIRAVRRHLLTDRGVARRDLSCSPYWRRTMTDEAWREIKGDYVAAMEAETA